ncbi:hypothetical protein FHS96_002081 [Sphingomonas zeicaulis]|uniref:DUF6491 family protein n=1 Tax=Sphingomonas zeicaulis TaxID=1632740 RepID=UPI003D232E67
MRRPFLILLPALAVIAAAPAEPPRTERAAKELASALKDRVPGKPQRCIQTLQTRATIIDGRTLIYYEGPNRVWRNELPEACPSLRWSSTLVSEVYGGQICDGDRVRAIDPGMSIPGPFCRLGSFVPYEKVKK